MKFKIFALVNAFFIALMLCGCKKTSEIVTTTTKRITTTTKKPIIADEYVLFDDEGTIKCKNFDYVICLEKEKGKEFKVLNLSDIQLTSTEISGNSDIATNAFNLIDELITETEPDLITLSGDQGYGEPVSIRAIATVIDKYNIPWAPVFGNHDNDCGSLTIRDQVRLYASYENCLMKYGPRQISGSEYGDRGGNYIINVVERDDNGFHIDRSIFMFNSGNKGYVVDYDVENRINTTTYEHLTDAQLRFYKWGLNCAKKYNNGEYPKSTIIEHIPITAYAHAFAEAFCTNYSAYEFDRVVSTSVGYTVKESYNEYCWKDGYKDSFGVCYEMICCSPIDDGVFEELTKYGSLDSMIVGHDHKNNFSINYKGVRLTYGLKTGWGCYFDSHLLGGTLFSFDGSNIKFEHIYK